MLLQGSRETQGILFTKRSVCVYLLVLLTQATAQAQVSQKGVAEPFEVMEIFEGDLEGTGYPRNEKAWRGEILVWGLRGFHCKLGPGRKMKREAPSGNQSSASGGREEERREGRKKASRSRVACQTSGGGLREPECQVGRTGQSGPRRKSWRYPNQL